MKTLLVALLLSTSAFAKDEPRDNLIGASVVGFAGFLRLNVGSYEVFYERRFGSHGVMATFDFIHVHQGSEHVGSHQWTFGGALTYRFFFDFAPGLFIGLKAGLRRGFGYYMVHTTEGMDRTDLVNSQWSLIPQAGFRFAPLPWLRITTRFGLGYGAYTVTPKDRTDAAALQAATISRDTLGTQSLVIDTELSLGFAF
ncbi:MAG: hypothetical protein QM817_33675 [Archangium sp.]